MSEIDFDELDKAVNSIMSQPSAASDKPGSDIKSPTMQTDSSTGQDLAAEASDRPATPVEPNLTSSKPARPAAPAAQRRGQFMDMIHPSAKMRETNPQSPRPRVSRQGAAISPRPSATDESQSTPAADTDIGQISSSQPPVSPQTEPQLSTSMDNPTTDNEPLQSPFLADAKVDKRPLGAPTKSTPADSSSDVAMQMSELNAVSSDSKTGNSEKQPANLPADEPPATPLPAELNNDILKVESAAATEPSSSDSKPASQQLDTQTTVHPTQMSIPPQYKTATPKVPKAEDDTPAASMYDQGFGSLKAPIKKKSSWPLVIGALVLISLGVIASMALFLLNHS